MSTDTPRVVVITGASSGVGLETAKALAAQGWRVIATGRNPERSAKAEQTIRDVSTNGQVDMLLVDLALMAEVERVASDIAALTDRVHVLVNNAGGIATEKVITREGLEENFAGNHLGPFLFTKRLLPLLKRAAADAPKASVRIINTSSEAGEMVPTLNLDDLQNLNNFSAGLAYCSGKLANALFARALAKLLKDDGIVAHSMHPGTVDSNFFTNLDEESMSHVRTYKMLTPEQGADTLIWLVTAEEPGQSSGGYFYHRAPRKPNPLIDDDTFIDRFWKESEKLVASVLA